MLNQMIFLLLTLIPLNHTMDAQLNRPQGRDSAYSRGAEGANLEQAKPDESLRQKDPVPESTLENPARDTDGVK